MRPDLRALCVSLPLWVPVATDALPWNQDMVDQPSVKPQESLVREPRGAVPVDGGELIARPESLADLVLDRVQAAAIPNPQPPQAESLARGKVLYETHCLPCHGASGKGDGPVGAKFTPPPMDLTLDYVRAQPDGQLYFTITYGSVVMPFYRDAIAAADRWHIVNYVKALETP